MNPSTLAEIERAIQYEAQRRDSPPEGFPSLPVVPGGRYTQQAFFELENEAVWRQSWVCVGLEADVARAGDYKCVDKLAAPIVLVRGMDDKLRAFYNTCRHRGARLTKESAGNAKHLRCQYHSWSYKLSGELMGVPEERDFIKLDKAEKGLLEMRCDVWNGLVFVTENNSAPAVAESLGQITQDFASIDIKSLRVVQHSTMHLKCNWKAGVDAFLESYHVKTIHKDTVSQMLNVDGTVMTLLDNGHSRMVMPRKGTSISMPMPTHPTSRACMRPSLPTPTSITSFPT
jgi:phenylpropionate dioxygenase-like ring-hydroxylating dioxygenase large terminal subunit